MEGALVHLLFVILVVGIVLWILLLLLDRIEMDATFKQVARAVLFLIAIVVVFTKLMPLISAF